MVPGRRPDEVLDDLALDSGQGGDRLRMLAIQRAREASQIARHMGLASLGLQSLLRGHDARAQTLHHGAEHVGRNAAVPPSCFLALCPRPWHRFASSPWPVDRAYRLEASETIRGDVMQRGSKEERPSV